MLESLRSFFSAGFVTGAQGGGPFLSFLAVPEGRGCDLWKSILYIRSQRSPNIYRTNALGSICKGLRGAEEPSCSCAPESSRVKKQRVPPSRPVLQHQKYPRESDSQSYILI